MFGLFNSSKSDSFDDKVDKHIDQNNQNEKGLKGYKYSDIQSIENLDADKARELTKVCADRRCERLIEYLESDIKNTVYNGGTITSRTINNIEPNYLTKVTNHFRDLGYAVRTDVHSNSTNIIISWREFGR